MLRLLVVDALAELGSESEQRRLWLSDGQSGRDVSSFADAVCKLFDDSGLSDAIDAGSTPLSDPALKQLRELEVLIERINGSRHPDEIIADPLMADVRNKAQLLLRLVSD